MAKSVTVILGAGASHGINLGPRALDNQAYRPPLTREIFQRSPEFESILNKYPLAEVLSSEIDRRIRRSNESLEEILRSYADGLAGGIDDHITREFLQVPLYLNTLFGEISVHFTKNPDQYSNLVNTALRQASQVLFLTLNYDILLEIPLARIHGINFSNGGHYSVGKWILVKLHGSSNWYRRFRGARAAPQDLKDYLEFLRQVPLPLSLEDDIYMVHMWTHSLHRLDNVPTYPALTVPVVGKYEVNCPPYLVEKAKQFLNECENYLVIGSSATDRDLLDLLKANSKPGRVWVVGHDEKGTQQTASRLVQAVPQLGGDVNVFFNQNGFAEFVEAGHMDNLFSQLK